MLSIDDVPCFIPVYKSGIFFLVDQIGKDKVLDVKL